MFSERESLRSAGKVITRDWTAEGNHPQIGQHPSNGGELLLGGRSQRARADRLFLDIRGPEEAKDKISAWLREEGSVFELKKDTKRQFHIVFTDIAGRSYNVYQPPKKHDKVVISGKVVLSERHRKGLQSLPQRIRARWLVDLRQALLYGGLNFGFFPSFSSIDTIIVRKPLWYDGITKNEFMQSVRQVNAGVALTLLRLRRRLGRP